MNISIISCSHREHSESERVSLILKEKFEKSFKNLNVNIIHLGQLKPPMWSENLSSLDKSWEKKWTKVSSQLIKSSAFIFVVPEYGGMATPQSKNFFLLCNKGELFHRPSLLVSVSSGTGGSYPISDLRSFSYKNSHIMWIPENIIIRHVNDYKPGYHGPNIPEWLDRRIDYCLNLIIVYAKKLKDLSKIVNRKDFGNGM